MPGVALRPLWGLALVLLSALSVQCAAPSDDANATASQFNLAEPDYTVYHPMQVLLQQIKDMAANNADIMKVDTLHAADGDYSVDLMLVTVEPAGISADVSQKVRILMAFGEHGRELITTEVGLELLKVLTNTTALSELVGAGRRMRRLQSILERTVFKMLPMENPKGREKVEKGKLCERKNGRGVDINRNWDIDWGKKEKDYDPSEEFPGRAPLSEPEVKIILSVAKSFKPQVWLNMHSGMYAMFTPYDHKAEIPKGPEALASLRILNIINQGACAGACTVGSGGQSVGYLAHGTGTDYMYEVLRVPLSFTWEIYGDQQAAFEDCFRIFNPLDRPAFDKLVRDWVLAVIQLLELLPTHPATLPLLSGVLPLTDAPVAQGPSPPAPDVSDVTAPAPGEVGDAPEAAAPLNATAAALAAAASAQRAAGGGGSVVLGPGAAAGSPMNRNHIIALVCGLAGLLVVCAIFARQHLRSPAGEQVAVADVEATRAVEVTARGLDSSHHPSTNGDAGGGDLARSSSFSVARDNGINSVPLLRSTSSSREAAAAALAAAREGSFSGSNGAAPAAAASAAAGAAGVAAVAAVRAVRVASFTQRRPSFTQLRMPAPIVRDSSTAARLASFAARRPSFTAVSTRDPDGSPPPAPIVGGGIFRTTSNVSQYAGSSTPPLRDPRVAASPIRQRVQSGAPPSPLSRSISSAAKDAAAAMSTSCNISPLRPRGSTVSFLRDPPPGSPRMRAISTTPRDFAAAVRESASVAVPGAAARRQVGELRTASFRVEPTPSTPPRAGASAVSSSLPTGGVFRTVSCMAAVASSGSLMRHYSAVHEGSDSSDEELTTGCLDPL